MTKSPSDGLSFDGRGYNTTVMRVPMPARIKKLPVSAQGYPIPWFVPWDGDEPITQAADPAKLREAVLHNKCWVCGDVMGVYKTFLIGPMCAVNRITSEPPQHRECAEYAAKVCPFLIKPAMKRNPIDDDRKRSPAGVFIERNPGVSLVWVTRGFKRFTPRGGGILFSVGDPIEILWFAEGRTATRAEILASMDSGLPFLMDAAKAQEATGIEGCVADVERSYQRALTLVPAETAHG